MGMYTGLRFKGVVAPEFRVMFRSIAMSGMWDKSLDPNFRNFGNLSRASFIPCGMLSYMPDSWESSTGVATDGFERDYNVETGYWAFQCSLKNYEEEIEDFLELLPYFILSVEHVEVFYESWEYSKKYDLIKGRIELVNPKFIKYQEPEVIS